MGVEAVCGPLGGGCRQHVQRRDAFATFAVQQTFVVDGPAHEPFFEHQQHDAPLLVDRHRGRVPVQVETSTQNRGGERHVGVGDADQGFAGHHVPQPNHSIHETGNQQVWTKGTNNKKGQRTALGTQACGGM